jgi:hypothetical protein
MKNLHKTLGKKLLVILVVGFGFIFGPSITAQMSLSQDNILNKKNVYLADNISPSVYDLLIIAPQKFVNALQPLITHKNNVGIRTHLVTLDEVYHQMFWQGRDEPEKIKFFIKTAKQEWGVRYVLLVGGRSSQFQPTWYCPVRYVSMVEDWDVDYLSDLYFADIYDAGGNFSSWDSDNDGIYGEWYPGETAQDTNIDLIPDVAVGRLPCRSEKEVKIMVQKIITYETTVFNQPWFTTMLVAAGDTYPESQNANWTGYEGEYYGDRAIENMSGFTSIRLYTSDGSFANKKDVMREFRNGWGFVYLVGHGSPKQWGNNAPNGTQFIQGPNSNDMWRFRNKDKLPVCVVSGCHNSQFDVCLRRLFNASARWKQEYIPECWSERILREPTGGAIAALGCTALGYTKEDKTSFKGGINELEGAFFYAYGQDHMTVLGDTWAAAITWYTQTYPVDWNSSAWGDSWIDTKVMQSWVLLGDPSLKIGGYPL